VHPPHVDARAGRPLGGRLEQGRSDVQGGDAGTGHGGWQGSVTRSRGDVEHLMSGVYTRELDQMLAEPRDHPVAHIGVITGRPQLRGRRSHLRGGSIHRYSMESIKSELK
jgi:hypothetical protein